MAYVVFNVLYSAQICMEVFSYEAVNGQAIIKNHKVTVEYSATDNSIEKKQDDGYEMQFHEDWICEHVSVWAVWLHQLLKKEAML